MALASDPLRKLTATPSGITVAGSIQAVGATIDPGGIDVKQVSVFRDNLTVQGTLFTPGGIAGGSIVAAWSTDVLVAAGQDLAVAVAGGADADYEWEAFVDYNATNVTLTARLSGSSSDMETVLYGVGMADIDVDTVVGFTGNGNGNGTTGTLSNNVGGTAAATAQFVRGRITQRSAMGVQITVDEYETDGDVRSVLTRHVRRTTTGAITSFGIHADNATGMNTGSWLRVRQITS